MEPSPLWFLKFTFSNPTNISVQASSETHMSEGKQERRNQNLNWIPTTNESTSTTVLSLPNGTERFISSVKHIPPINNPLNILKPRFENPEVSLLAICCLFGLLGASVAGITSWYKQKLWESTSELNKRRTYLYVVRPWLGASVAIITYVALRTGLINFAMPGGGQNHIPPINQFGIAAISATVGLMTDQIYCQVQKAIQRTNGNTKGWITRRRSSNKDHSRRLYPTGRGPNTGFGKLSDDTDLQDLNAEFTSANTNTIQITGQNPVEFDKAGIASMAITPAASGVSDVIVNVLLKTDNSIVISARSTIRIVKWNCIVSSLYLEDSLQILKEFGI